MNTQEQALEKIRVAKVTYEEEMRKLDERQRRLLEAVVERIDRNAVEQLRQKLKQL